MRRTKLERRRVDPGCPSDLRRRVYQALTLGITGQQIRLGERLPDLVARVCPAATSFAILEGYEVVLDLPANTHEALCLGEIAVEIRRRA